MTTPLTFLRQTADELKKVTWPTQNEVIRLTMLVLFVSILVGLYIGALDYIFAQILGLLVQR